MFSLIPLCSGGGAPVVSAGGLLETVCGGRTRAAELGPPDHREHELLRHPREKYELVNFVLFGSDYKSLGSARWSMFDVHGNVCTVAVSMLGPLTTPEHQLNKTPSSSSLSQRMKSSLTPR